MKIAFQTHPGQDWAAGATALVSILQALRALEQAAPELALVVWEGTQTERYRAALPYVDRTIIAPPAPPPEGELVYLASLRSHLAHWARARLLRRPPAPAAAFRSDALRAQGVDCTFSLPLQRRTDFGVPLIVWLPDLQHHHLPEMCSPEEAAARDRNYRSEIEAATLVLVTAETVRQDVQRFAPAHAARARVLPFVVPVPSALYDCDPAEAAAKYHLPQRFIWLPNQFWRHKNHLLVLEALRLLRDRAVCPVVVCAGNPHDHRNPLFFSQLMHQAALWGLREQFLFIGMLPHEENLLLMRQALCVLNPSLFEGFGFSAAESRAIGKRALLSDLPAHREQDPPGALYFAPRDARDLAAKLAMIWETVEPGPDLEMEAAARAEFPRRQQAFGQAFLGLASEAVALAGTQ